MEWCLKATTEIKEIKGTNSYSSCNECWQLPEDFDNTFQLMNSNALQKKTLKKRHFEERG